MILDIVRWGILGAASIARRHAVPAINAVPEARAVAVASRDINKAKAFAAELGIERAYGNYEALLGDTDIDAVYIPLPNHLHLQWIEKALQAGKHVLCEKPLGLQAVDVRLIMQWAQAAQRLVVEGVTSYFNPIHEQAAQLIKAGDVGELRFISISLGWSFADKPDDFRWRPEQGGGALYDIGGYCISTARRLAGREPEQVTAVARYRSESGRDDGRGAGDGPCAGDGRCVGHDHDVDTDMAVMLTFSHGLNALIDFSLLSAFRNEYTAIGSSGKLTVEMPFGNGAARRTIRLWDVRGGSAGKCAVDAHQMQAQFRAVSQAIASGGPSPLPLTESLANAVILDACRSSAQAGGCCVRL